MNRKIICIYILFLPLYRGNEREVKNIKTRKNIGFTGKEQKCFFEPNKKKLFFILMLYQAIKLKFSMILPLFSLSLSSLAII